MNKKAILPFLIITILVGVVATKMLYQNKSQSPQSAKTNTAPNVVSTETPEPDDFTASFEIYTNGTRRIFTTAMYHNRSQDVYIQNPNPNTIFVKKVGVTWRDFFKTLPFTLTDDCLITGTSQTFCNSKTHSLRFFLNNSESPNTLDEKIRPGDALRVVYESK